MGLRDRYIYLGFKVCGFFLLLLLFFSFFFFGAKEAQKKRWKKSSKPGKKRSKNARHKKRLGDKIEGKKKTPLFYCKIFRSNMRGYSCFFPFPSVFWAKKALPPALRLMASSLFRGLGQTTVEIFCFLSFFLCKMRCSSILMRDGVVYSWDMYLLV